MALSYALTDSGDLDLSRGGPRLVSGVEAAKTALFYRFSTFAGTGSSDPGEWRYDYRYGVPWRTAVFGRYFSPDETQAVLADVATRTTGVDPVAPYQVSLSTDSQTRRVSIVMTQLSSGGTLAEGPVTLALPNDVLL